MPNTPRVVTGPNQDTTGRVITQDYGAPAYAASIALTPTEQFTTYKVGALTGDLTLTAGATLPYIGDEMTLFFTASAADRTVTFSTGFTGLASLVVASGASATAKFLFNGAAWVYASSGTLGVSDVQTPAYAATLAITPVARHTVIIPAQLTGAMTINATVTGMQAGDKVDFAFSADGTNRVVTFGTNIKSSGTLTVTASKWAGATGVFDGTYIILQGREISA